MINEIQIIKSLLPLHDEQAILQAIDFIIDNFDDVTTVQKEQLKIIADNTKKHINNIRGYTKCTKYLDDNPMVILLSVLFVKQIMLSVSDIMNIGVMAGPVVQTKLFDNIDIIAEAGCKKLRTRLEYKPVDEISSETLCEFVQDISEEFICDVMCILKHHGKKIQNMAYFLYCPIMLSGGIVDPVSYETFYSTMTRYALYIGEN